MALPPISCVTGALWPNQLIGGKKAWDTLLLGLEAQENMISSGLPHLQYNSTQVTARRLDEWGPLLEIISRT